MSRKVGRPRKKYAPGERLTTVSAAIPVSLSDAIPSNSNLSNEFRTYLQLRYGGKGKTEIELQILDQKIKEIQDQLATLLAEREMITNRLKREDEERRMIEFQKNAVSFYLKAVIKNIHDGGYYDLDEEVRRLERDFGILVPKTSFLSAIRNPGSLPDGGDLLTDLGVRFTPGCQSTRYWNSMMQDYRKFLDSKEGA